MDVKEYYNAFNLFPMTELVTNNSECVVIKVRDGNEMNLISIGCFNGDEAMFRLTKGKDVTCTVWHKDGRSCSWEWGSSGYTLVTDRTKKMGHIIQQCIEHFYKIKCEY